MRNLLQGFAGPLDWAQRWLHQLEHGGATLEVLEALTHKRKTPPLRSLSPQAAESSQRVAVLQGRSVPYELQRSSRRRTIGFSVSEAGLRVSAPTRTTITAIDSLLQQKAKWILDKLNSMQARVYKQQIQQLAWMDAALQIRFLGETIPAPPEVLAGRDAGARARAAQQWLQAQARLYFPQRLAFWAEKMQLRPNKLRLSSARTRWGSASSKGVISLHWRLMQFRPEVLDYVVVHELAHLRHMHHGPDFWALVARHLPDFRTHSNALRRASPSDWV